MCRRICLPAFGWRWHTAHSVFWHAAIMFQRTQITLLRKVKSVFMVRNSWTVRRRTKSSADKHAEVKVVTTNTIPIICFLTTILLWLPILSKYDSNPHWARMKLSNMTGPLAVCLDETDAKFQLGLSFVSDPTNAAFYYMKSECLCIVSTPSRASHELLMVGILCLECSLRDISLSSEIFPLPT